MGRRPIGEEAMTDAERQARRRAKLFDAEGLAVKLATKIANDERYRALIAAMVVGLGQGFVTKHVTEGFEHPSGSQCGSQGAQGRSPPKIA